MSVIIPVRSGDDVVCAYTQIYGNMLLLENELEHYSKAFRYAELMTRKNRDDVMGFQFTRYLAYVLDLPEKAEAARPKLVELQDRGVLSRPGSNNLDLFPTNGRLSLVSRICGRISSRSPTPFTRMISVVHRS